MKALIPAAQLLTAFITLSLASDCSAQIPQPYPLSLAKYQVTTPGSATAAVIQADGKIIVAGTFIIANGAFQTNMARINTDGTVDPTWNLSYNGTIQSMLINGTDLYMTGTFTNLGGLGINYLARLSTTTGAVDPTWNPNPDGNVTKLLLNGTTLYVSGLFSNIGGANIPYLAKLDTIGGSADSAWNPNLTGSVDDFALGGTNIFIAGGGASVGGLTRYGLAKLDAGGTAAVDPTWCMRVLNGPGVYGVAQSIVANDTNVYVGGIIAGVSYPNSGVSNYYYNYITVLKLSASGEGDLDTNWKPPGPFASSTMVPRMVLNADTLFFETYNYLLNENNVNAVSALGTGQQIWTDLINPPGAPPLSSIVLDGGSLLLTGILMNRGNNSYETGIVILDPATGAQIPSGTIYLSETIVEAFNQVVGTVTASTVLSDGRVAIGGNFTVAIPNGQLHNFAIINSNGASDTNWAPALSPSPSMMTSFGTNIYLVYQSSNSATISRCSSQGSGAVDSWSVSVGGTIYCVLPTPTDVFVGGSFSTANGQSWRNLVDLNVTNASVKPGFAINGPVYSLAFANPYYLYIGGAFGLINGSFQNNLAREFIVNGSNAGLDTSWNPGTIGPVNALAADSASGMLYVGGGLTNLAGNTVQYLGRVRTTDAGTLDGSWLPAFSGPVTNLNLIGQNLYALGSFTSVGGLARNGVARLATTGNGAPDPYWNIQTDGQLNTLTVFGSQISAGGNFTTINGASRAGFALLENWPMILPPAAMTPGGFQFGLAPDSGRACRVQSSVDLLTWSDLSSIVLAATNTIFTDTNAAIFPQKFYRLVSP